MLLFSHDIAVITKGRLVGPDSLEVSDIITDSRNFSFIEMVAFVAIKGSNHDGHNYIGTLYQKGVRVFIISHLYQELYDYPSAAFIICKDTVAALQQLAAYQRQCFNGKVIGITGSAGKTVVKEWLSDVLSLMTSVVRSPKSYNSQIGVPLSVLKLDNKYRYGIFEAGISFPGEMGKLEQIIKPEIGIITNIGDAHDENFRDKKVKGFEKLKLFVNASLIVYCRDQKLLRELILNDDNLSSKELVDWSFDDTKAALYVKKKLLDNGRTSLEILYKGACMEFEIPFSDRASIENAITVIAACLALGLRSETIRRGLSVLVSVAMRMEIKSGINNCQLIEDYYNSDPGSLRMALDFLKSQNQKKTSLILSDFIQSGRDEKELYPEVAELLKRADIDKFIGIGKALCNSKTSFEMNSAFYESTDEFIRSFNSKSFNDEIILIKGARSFEFEKIGLLLERQVHTTILEINLDAISHNLNELRGHLNPGTKFMAVVKAFAYGTGAAEIAALLEYHRVNYLAVACIDEGVTLRKEGISIPIMVMNPDSSYYDQLIRYDLEPEIYSVSSFDRFVNLASKHGLLDYPVHIKVDTGMHRLGFLLEDVDELVLKIRNLDCIRIMSVFSHLSGSESDSLDEFTRGQVSLLLDFASKIKEVTKYPFLLHILNTYGIERFPQYQFDMVRPGLGIYGVGNYKNLSVRPALRFLTRISQVKTVPAGEPIGYGCKDVADEDRIIAILPVGYADGLNRKLGNGTGNFFIRGERTETVGNICMDMCMTDITDTDAMEGDEVEIFGNNIRIDELAAKCDTIPQEILTSIPLRVKRIFFRE